MKKKLLAVPLLLAGLSFNQNVHAQEKVEHNHQESEIEELPGAYDQLEQVSEEEAKETVPEKENTVDELEEKSDVIPNEEENIEVVESTEESIDIEIKDSSKEVEIEAETLTEIKVEKEEAIKSIEDDKNEDSLRVTKAQSLNTSSEDTQSSINSTPQTADEWLVYAASQSSSSMRLTYYMEGFEQYPQDVRFIDGINSSARSLMTWATGQHNNEDFDIAAGRYEFILSAPNLQVGIFREAKAKLYYADQNKVIPTANQMVEYANKGASSSPRLERFMEGYNLYPRDRRFESGINKNAQSLFRWSIDQHYAGRYDVAIGRYEFILTAPVLAQDIRLNTILKLEEATLGKRPADVIYEDALNQSASTMRLTLHIEGHGFYPEDSRFVNGIATSANSLLNWAKSQHQLGEIDVALGRYEFILTAPDLPELIRTNTELLRSYAIQGDELPTANQLLDIANSQSSSSPRLEKFIEGYTLYPNDARFIEGINRNAQSLLNWSIEQHHEGRYDVAIGRYEYILSAPKLAGNIKSSTETKLSEAKQSKRPANVIYELAQLQSSSSAKLALHLEGNQFYPNDIRFLSGINESSRSLFYWAKRQHSEERFDVAIDRYNYILSISQVQSSIKTDTRNLKTLAESGVTPDRERVTYVTYNLTLNDAIALQSKQSTPPQTDLYRNAPAYIHSSLVNIVDRGSLTDDGINIRTTPRLGSSNNIYGNYNRGTTFSIVKEVTGDTTAGSNKWYEIKFENETLYVHTSLARLTKAAVVQQGGNIRELASTNSHVFGSVSKNEEFSVVKTVKGSTFEGDNTWYEISYSNMWRNAKPSDFQKYIDPEQNSRMQHLALDKSVGLSASQINIILSGKGILDGLGQAFIDAGSTHKVNEIYLISHALLETGNGGSGLANGLEVGRDSKGELVLVNSSNRSSLTGIKKTYNMFGIGANDSDPYRLGAIYAYESGWFTPRDAIIGGASFVANSYFARGQNTLYKMKWNHHYLNSDGYYPQYATDMGWAVKQVGRIESLYALLDNPTLHLDIVRYK
ncbi:N-acetylglucosaminidase [Sutcliffiella horikoshii]|uniref:N-acetylglucosaminidase n=1 Tax=Sutcliffiella horikoshii TaxID=79883 RepID=UPI003CEE5829